VPELALAPHCPTGKRSYPGLSSMDRSEKFHREMDRLESHLPDWAKGAFRRARTAQAMRMRLTVATLLIIGGILGVVLPIPGMVPLGLALLAIDVPVLRVPLHAFWPSSTASLPRGSAEPPR